MSGKPWSKYLTFAENLKLFANTTRTEIKSGRHDLPVDDDCGMAEYLKQCLKRSKAEQIELLADISYLRLVWNTIKEHEALTNSGKVVGVSQIDYLRGVLERNGVCSF
jgi:hypothetical protein